MSANSLVKIVGNHAVVYNIEPGKTDLRQWGIVKFVLIRRTVVGDFADQQQAL